MKTHDLKEILEIEGHKHLVALQESLSYSGHEKPSVYITKGILHGICIVTGINYEVIKDYKLIFYKKLTEASFMSGNDKGKFWFEIQLNMTEEEADQRIQAKNRALSEDSTMRRRVLG